MIANGKNMTQKQRMREWRAKKAQEGGRSLSIWLDPNTVAQLDALRKHFGKSGRGRNKPLIVRAIRLLYKSTFNQ
jgi:hypothetical protein